VRDPLPRTRITKNSRPGVFGWRLEAGVVKYSHMEKLPTFENSNETVREFRQKEQDLAERLKGKAKNLARVFSVITAFSLGAEAQAGEVDMFPSFQDTLSDMKADLGKENNRNKENKFALPQEFKQEGTPTRPESQSQEVVGKNEVEPSEENLEYDLSKATNSRWAGKAVEKAKEEMNQLETSEDGKWWIRTHLRTMVEGFYPLDGKSREFNADDCKHIASSAIELKKLFGQLEEKFPDLSSSVLGANEQLDDIIQKAKSKSSYTRQKQQELLKNMKNFKY